MKDVPYQDILKDFNLCLQHAKDFLAEVSDTRDELSLMMLENGAVDIAGFLSTHAKAAHNSDTNTREDYRLTAQALLDFMGEKSGNLAAQKNATTISNFSAYFDIRVPESLDPGFGFPTFTR